jgi:hypothetical protein
MVTLDETAKALEGIYRLAIFDRTAVASFGQDLRSCARSFWAYVLALPAILLLIAVSVTFKNPHDPALLAISELVSDVIQATGFPLLLLPLLRWFGRRERWAWFVTGYNWFNMAQIVVAAVLVCLLGDLPGENLRDFLSDAATTYFYVLEAYLAFAILEISARRAVFVLLLDFAFGNVIGQLALWIGGASLDVTITKVISLLARLTGGLS